MAFVFLYVTVPNKKEAVHLVENVTDLNCIFYFDDPKRHSEIDFYGDYIIRRATAIALFQLERLQTKKPLDVPQDRLYSEAKSLYEESCRSLHET